MRKMFAAVFVMGVFAVPMARLCVAQDAPAAAVAPAAGSDADKPRIYVTDSNSWQMTGSSGGGFHHGSGGFGSAMAGGAAPQTAEIIKTFTQRCPQVLINNRMEMGDYIVELDHEGGKGFLAHKDKVAVFVRKSGDSIFSESTLSVGGSVQDACKAITDHWSKHAIEITAMADPAKAAAAQTIVVTAPAAVAAPVKTSINVTSTPAGADITINGSFVGNTPSLVEVDPGENTVVIAKKGYKDWTRTLKIKGGTINLNAELEGK